MATRKKSSKRKSVKRRGTARSADAIALLRADHTKVQDLFSQFEKARNDDRKRTLAARICAELTVHTTIEEEIFYPAVREVLDEEDLLDEAAVEHASAKELISQIQGGSPADDKWDAKVTVLGEYIKHHVKEEQNEMFPKVRKTKLDLRLIGDQLRARKQELQE
jgi:hemerythrin superfamily protein